MEITEGIQAIIDSDAIMIATLSRAVKDRYGDEGIVLLQNAMEEKFLRIMPSLAKHVGATINNGGPADWAKLEEHICRSLGMVTEFEVTAERGIMHMISCPFLTQYKRKFPQVCPEVMIGCERAIARTINPKLKVQGRRYMPMGDKVCEIVVEFDSD